MAVTSQWYDRATKYIGDSTYGAIATQAVTVALLTSSYTFSAAHVVYADLTNELTTAGGYTLGGQLLASPTFVQASAVTNYDATDPSWTASGGGIPAFRYAVFYINATVNSIVKPLLLCVGDVAADVPATVAPNPLSIQLNATGLFQITHS